MKLKKIASLALAGVMAVSMLAGCATDKKPGTGEGEGEGTVTTTGYSAKLEDAMDLTDDQAKYISFKDNTADQAALEKAVAGLSTDSVYNVAKRFNVATPIVAGTAQYGEDAVSADDLKAMLEDLPDALGTVDGWNADLGAVTMFNAAEKYTNNSELRGAALFVVNGGVDTETALKAVANKLTTNKNNGSISNMVSDHTVTSTNGNITYEYNYVMSASVVTRAQQDNFTGVNNSATFILVTTTRTLA